uniref:Uncharacterized protein n=1 Tax=Mola mola TaxID=94237 RepID=A0A3Q3WU00_MOLML
MSEPDSCVGDQAPLVLESFSTKLHISEPGDDCCQPQSSPTRQCETLQEDVNREAAPQQAVLSSQSPAALKTGTRQLIPKNLAAASRPRYRYHTTVVTLPVSLQKSISGTRTRHSAQGADVSWEDYDSDGDGFALRRNRRNKSYRAAVTSLDRTFGRKKNQNHRGSFKDRLYQEIRERGLNSTNQDELLDDFVVVEPPVEDQAIVVKSYRPAQLTWSQLPQVKDTGVLAMISTQERKRQEAIFEIITSEHSYLHSLGILVRHFKSDEALRKTMTATEHHHLFSNISVIHQVSFFEDLERRHYDNPVIRDISDIVQNHASHHFEPYIVYCSNETFQQRTLQKLTDNAAFKETLKQIEGSSECGGLPMISFLILPMQRVTRLPLLLDQLVTSCNDGATRMERTEQMYTIQKQMDFGKIKPFPLVSASRWLKKRGELTIVSEEVSIWRAFGHKSYYLFLFNDVLIVTRKKEESFVVMDYATLENVKVQYEATKAYMPKEPDELGLRQAELVIVLQKEE